ncbi:hypothetical protein NC651_035290 [Populus alba x Populus x berolinensis]|nr:hypothetical protein NC651_035290 [Populus alba x Populus x berolinensis]
MISSAKTMPNSLQVGGRTLRVNFPEVPRGGEREVMEPRIRMSTRYMQETLDGVSLLKSSTRETRGRSRGFGFVSFESAENAEAALEAMNGEEVEGRPLRLNLAGERSYPPQLRKTTQKTILRAVNCCLAIGA